MFDQSARTIWLNDQLWKAVRRTWPQLQRLPEQGLLTVSFPSSGARGASAKMKVAEVNFQWSGNSSEPFMLAIHPVSFRGSTPREQAVNVIKATAFAALKYCDGARWGAVRAGFTKQDDGSIDCTPEAQARIDAIIDDVGEPPAGYGNPFPVRQVERTRLRRYACKEKFCTATDSNSNRKPHPIIRAASDDSKFLCGECGGEYQLS